MAYSERLVSYLKKVETLVSPARHLAADRPEVITGGYGETSSVLVHDGMKVTEAMADKWLRQRLDTLAMLIRREVPETLTQYQLDALISWVYNVGYGAFLHSTLLKRLKEGDQAAAAREFANWTFANGKELPGLVIRREVEAEWFRSGIKELTKA